jgi:hypothetical protein
MGMIRTGEALAILFRPHAVGAPVRLRSEGRTPFSPEPWHELRTDLGRTMAGRNLSAYQRDHHATTISIRIMASAINIQF